VNRHFASVLTLAAMTAAAGVAAIASSNAYAETPTIDNTPFVSTRTRAEVQAEVMGRAEQLRMASSEGSMQLSQASEPHAGVTVAQAKAGYIAARDEVSAMTSEDSGSSYLTRQSARTNAGITIAGAAR
jgi:hypothetical protein